jgi:hypothetical protein
VKYANVGVCFQVRIREARREDISDKSVKLKPSNTASSSRPGLAQLGYRFPAVYCRVVRWNLLPNGCLDGTLWGRPALGVQQKLGLRFLSCRSYLVLD